MNTNYQLTPMEAMPRCQRNLNNERWINIIREPYKEITAYFLRNHKATLLFVNSNLDIQEQAKAIKIIEKEIAKCPVSKMGLIDKDWNYKCNGVCCK